MSEESKIISERAAVAILPMEIWHRVFSFLDRKSLLTSASHVCKDWLELIRNDVRLGSCLYLNESVTHSEMEEILRKWPRLKTLFYQCHRFDDELIENPNWHKSGKSYLPQWKAMDFKQNPQLEKIVFCIQEDRYQNWQVQRNVHSSFRCKKFCLYPRHLKEENLMDKLAMPLELEPVKAFRKVDDWSEYEDNRKRMKSDHVNGSIDEHEIRKRLRELEKLKVSAYYDDRCKLLEEAPKLQILECEGYWRISGLNEVLSKTANYCPHVRELIVKGGIIEDLAASLKSNLEKLSLVNIKITKACVNQNWKDVTCLKLVDCDIRKDFVKFLLTFPSLHELHVYENCGWEDIWPIIGETKDKFSNFSDLVDHITDLKVLRKLRWETMKSLLHKKTECSWERDLKGLGHFILKRLRMHHLLCDVEITLTTGSLNSANLGKIMSFSKKADNVEWTMYQWMSNTDLICHGEENCVCEDI